MINRTLEKLGRYESGQAEVGLSEFVELAYAASDWLKKSWVKPIEGGLWGQVKLRPNDLLSGQDENRWHGDALQDVTLRINGLLAAGRYAHEMGGTITENEIPDYEMDAQRAIASVVTDLWLGAGKHDVMTGDLVFNAFNSVVGVDKAFYLLYTAAIDKGLQRINTEYQDVVTGEPKGTISFWREVGEGSTQLVFDDQLRKDGGKREKMNRDNKVVTHDVRSLIASKGSSEKKWVDEFESMLSMRAQFVITPETLSRTRSDALSTVIAQKLRKFGIGTKIDAVRAAEEEYQSARHEYRLPVGASVWFGGFALLFEKAALEGLKRGMSMFPEPGSFGGISPLEAIVASVAFAMIAAPIMPSVFDIGRVVEARKSLESAKAR